MKKIEKESLNRINEIDVSVVLCTYNQENCIAEVLESIIFQSDVVEYEIIVSDDCSTDNTGLIIKDYEKRFPNIVRAYIQPENLGVPMHYYKVLRMCRGSYIMECGGDDLWLPGKMDYQFKYMKNNPNIGLIYGKTLIRNEKGDIRNNHLGDERGERIEEMLTANYIPTLTVCMKKEDVFEYLDSIKPEYRNWKMEDYPMWLWFCKNKSIKFINKLFGIYSIVEDSVSHQKDLEHRKKFTESVRDVQMFFAANEKEKRSIQSQYNITCANYALIANDVYNYREYNKFSQTKKGIIKNIISYMPGGFLLIRKYYMKKIF